MPDTRHGLACAGIDTSLGLRFVQERLGLVGKTVFLLSGGFYVLSNVPILTSGLVPLFDLFLHPGSVIHLGATLVMGVLWALARWRCWSRSTLGGMDAVSLIVCCGAWGLLTLGGEPEGLFVAMLATTVTVVARAILVPSSGKRTFWLTTVACTPLFVLAVLFATPPTANTEFHFSRALLDTMTVLNTGLWIGCAVALATDPARRPPSAAALQERLRHIAAAAPWSAERAQRWWSAHAPSAAESRPAADILLSHEARPMRVIRHLRN